MMAAATPIRIIWLFPLFMVTIVSSPRSDAHVTDITTANCRAPNYESGASPGKRRARPPGGQAWSADAPDLRRSRQSRAARRSHKH